ncbi:MAG: DotA/TraY family protein [Burkholderiales bacterium]
MNPTSLDAATLQGAAITGTGSQLSAQALLTQLFGTIASDPMSALSGGAGGLAGGDVLGMIFMYINVGLLTFGSLYMAYKSLVAVTQTAHDGDFMGRAYHSVWVPIRIVTGVFSLLPVFNGWSALQVIMLWFGVMGAGLGNLAWQTVATNFEPYTSLVSSTSPNSSFDPSFAPEIYKMYACVEAHNVDNQKARWPSPAWGVSSPTADPAGGADNIVSFGSNGGKNDECGSVSLPTVLNTGNAGNVLPTSYLGSSVNTTIGAATAAQQQALVTTATSRFANLQSQIQPPAVTFADSVGAQIAAGNTSTAASVTPYNPAQMYQFSVNYQQNLVTQMASTMKNLDMSSSIKQAMENSAQQDGFTTAGAWYTTMAAMSYAINQMAESTGAAIRTRAQAPTDVWSSPVWNAVYTDINAVEKSAGMTAASSQGTAPSNDSSEGAAWKLVTSQMSSDPSWLSFMSSPGQVLVNKFVTDGSNLPVILRMKNIGDFGTSITEAVITAVGAIKGEAEGIKNSVAGWVANNVSLGVSSAIIGAATPWLDYILFIAQLAMGAFVTLSLFIPMIPFLVYLGQVVSWLVGVIEGVVAAPFLAFAHLDASGEEGLGQRTHYGYTFMLQSFMRPVMLVFGFIVASKLTDTMGGFLMNEYPVMIANIQMNSVTGLISIFILIVFFMFLSISVINSCMSVMYIIPEALWRFMGADTSQTTQIGRDTGRMGEGFAAMVVSPELFGKRKNQTATGGSKGIAISG